MKLVPNNWLYNAGLVGFLRILQSKGVNVVERLNDNGFELRGEDLDGFADAYAKCVLQASIGRFVPWLKKEDRTLIDDFGANYAKTHKDYLERLRQELSLSDTIQQAEERVRVTVNSLIVEVVQRIEQGLKTQREQLAQSSPENKVEQKELDKRKRSLERNGARAKKVIEEIRNTTGLLETQKYIVSVLQRFYFNKAVIGQYRIATDNMRIHQFEKVYVIPAVNSLEAIDSHDMISCKFCGRSCVELVDGRLQDSVFSEGLFYIAGVSVTEFPNFFYNLIPDLFICDFCELTLLCTWAGFNPIPLRLKSGDKDSEYLFVSLPSLSSLWYENEAVRERYERAEISRKDTVMYEEILTDLFSKERKEQSKWVLQNILFVEIRPPKPSKQKDRPSFKYFHVGKDVAELFIITPANISLSRIGGRLATPSDKEGIRSLWLKREVVKRLLSGDQIYDLAYQVCRQSLDNRWVRAGNAIEIVFLHSLRKQIWREYSDKPGYDPKQKSMERKIMTPRQIYGILQGFSEAGARLADAATQDLKSPDEKLKKCQRMAYRLMSIVRSGKYAEFYDMLMKLYVDSGRPIPTNLLGLLNPNDDIEFEAKAYALLSGFLGESQSKGVPKEKNDEPPQVIHENPFEEEQVNGQGFNVHSDL